MGGAWECIDIPTIQLPFRDKQAKFVISYHQLLLTKSIGALTPGSLNGSYWPGPGPALPSKQNRKMKSLIPGSLNGSYWPGPGPALPSKPNRKIKSLTQFLSV